MLGGSAPHTCFCEDEDMIYDILRLPPVDVYPFQLHVQAEWLERRLGVDRGAVSKVLKLNPSLFGSNIENSLEPKLEWLREGLGLEEADIAAVVRACPNVLR